MKSRDHVWKPVIIAISVVVPLVVALLYLLPAEVKAGTGETDLGRMPFFHATLNGSTALLLVLGRFFAARKQVQWHRLSMLTAFCLSAVFLVSYVIYHGSVPNASYGGEWGALYYPILISHIVLSIPVLPLAMLAIYRGLTGDIVRHRKIVRWTFPVWLYVACTGVLVYAFMAPYYI